MEGKRMNANNGTQYSGLENLGNNMIMQSNPNFAACKTPNRTLRTTQLRKPPIRVPKTPQSARVPMNDDDETEAPQFEADVRVFLRIRPLLNHETQADFDIQGNMVFARSSQKSNSDHYAERNYRFSEIFDSTVTQETIFDKVAMPLLKRFMHGVDSLLFSYGATSAGKTYTVQGTPNDPGLIPRIVKTLLVMSPPKGTERGLFVSCVEVYNERIHDLLGDNTKTLRIGRDGFNFTTVKGVSETELKNEDDLYKILKSIDLARKKSSTSYNSNSSRSHCAFMLKYITIPVETHTGKRTSDLKQIKCTRLCVVDLAGSEKVNPTDSNTKTVTEACNINKSMLVLGKCIREIRKANNGISAQIPFRESKLTELFRDFFDPYMGRETMTSIIVNISPSTAQFGDTTFSLRFAAEAAECNVKSDFDDENESDEDFHINSVDLDSEDEESELPRSFVAQEAKIRQEIHEEMAERFKKIQADFQNQIEQIRAQSNQPYTSKLQQALAQRMQTETRTKEISEARMELDRERKRNVQLEKEIEDAKFKLDNAKRDLESALVKNSSLESNIARMIDATKKLQERHVALQSELQQKTVDLETFWQRRIQTLEIELKKLQNE